MMDDKWEELKKWVDEQMVDRYYDNDIYRYTAYESVRNKMNELEGDDER